MMYRYIVTEQRLYGERWYHVCDTESGDVVFETMSRTAAHAFCDNLNYSLEVLEYA